METRRRTADDLCRKFPVSDAPSQRPLPVPKGLLMNLLLRPVRSSLGSKYVMAVTGLGLIGFVIAHMLGNLQIFLGKQALNDYAHHLEEIPTILWTLRAGLLAIFVIHILFGLRLWRHNQ